MTFTVEDGTGLATANAYVSVATADAYFTERGDTTWTGSDATKQGAIIKATQFLDASYVFTGVLRFDTQALSWPRAYATDKDGRALEADEVPQRVKDACCELALYALGASLAPNIVGTDRVARVKAGSAEVEFETGARDVGTRFALVDRLLAGLTTGGAGMSRMTARGW